MKTKSSAKSSSSKTASGSKIPAKAAKGKPTGPASKLASLKGAVKSAFFGSSKSNAKAGGKPDPKTAAKTVAKTMGGKSAKAAPVATVAKVPAAKALPPGKTAKGKANPAPTPAKAQAGGKVSKGAVSAPRAASRSAIDAESVCREVACEGLSTTGGYCRLHYVKNWKKIKRKELILKEGKLNQYIEELVAKYPDKYIEAIRSDLADDKAFAKVIYDLDLDESVDEFDAEGENVDSLIDTIKRDFDDEGETF